MVDWQPVASKAVSHSVLNPEYSDLTPLRLTYDRESVAVLRYTSLGIGAIANCEVY
jgi:hypothetical protein